MWITKRFNAVKGISDTIVSETPFPEIILGVHSYLIIIDEAITLGKLHN